MGNSSETKIDDYRIYAPFCSKNDTTSTFIDCFNPSTNYWHRATSIPSGDEHLVMKDFAMVSHGHHIYVIGGRLCRHRLAVPLPEHHTTHYVPRVVPTVRRYNVRTDTWETCASMAQARFNFGCTVFNGKIYVAGGQSSLGTAQGISATEVYDPALDQWMSLANMSTMRYKCVAVVRQGKLHVVGGFVSGGAAGQIPGPFVMARSSAEVYDADCDRWDFMARMWDLDVPPNQIVAVNGKLFSSGDCFMHWKGHIEGYDENENMWSVVHGSHSDCLSPSSTTPDQVQRLYLTMAPIKNQLYFLAGYRMPGEVSRMRTEVHVFDTAASGDGWLSFDPFWEDGEKELCGHCCVLKQD